MNVLEIPPPRHVFLTGATGAIGSRVLGALVEEESSTTVTVLLRDSRSGSPPSKRLGDILTFLNRDPRDTALTQRITIASGDVTKPGLGMIPGAYTEAVRKSTHLIHASGNVKLNQSLEDARHDAVTSAQEMVRFIHACRRNSQFIKAEYLSTVGVGGHREGIIPETPLPDPRHFRNTYEAAKAEAEDYVLAQIQAGLPVTIHRPSMVVGDSRTGAIIHFQVFYYLLEFLLGTRSWGLIPRLGTLRLDTIPVDYVAQAVLLASSDPSTVGRVFHLCAGPIQSLPLTVITAMARERADHFGLRLPMLKTINPAWISPVLPLLSGLLPRKIQRELKSVPFLLSYLAEDQRFENAQSQEYFASKGLHASPVDSYLPRLIDHYLEKRNR